MPEFEPVEYELRDASARGVVWCGAGLALALLLSFGAITLFEHVLARANRVPLRESIAPRVEIPAPRLQANPAADLAALRAEEEARLHGYCWVDRQAGIIHIPIERAIELTAQRGLPARKSEKGGAK